MLKESRGARKRAFHEAEQAERESIKREWQKQAEEVKQRFTSVVTEHDDPVVQEMIDQNIDVLWQDIHKYTSPQLRRIKDIKPVPLEKLKSLLATIPSEIISDDPPQIMGLTQKGSIGIMINRPKSYKFTGPKNMAMLFDRYGLGNGEIKSLEKLAQEYNVPGWLSPQVVMQALSFIQEQPTFQKLLHPTMPEWFDKENHLQGE